MRADLSAVVRGLNLRNSIPSAGGLQGRGESRAWRKLKYTRDPGSRSPHSLGGGEGELLLGALPTPGDARPLAQEDRQREKVGASVPREERTLRVLGVAEEGLETALVGGRGPGWPWPGEFRKPQQ